MNTRSTTSRHRAFTFVDLLIVVGTVLLGFGVLVGTQQRRCKVSAPRINCVFNLKQIGLAFRMWANDHGGQFPMELSTLSTNAGTLDYNLTGEVWRHFQILSNELSTPKVLICGADTRQRVSQWADLIGNRNISYFVGLDADEVNPQSILAGDRNIIGAPRSSTGVLTITTNDRVEWTKAIHKEQGNVGLGDGSAQQLTGNNLNKQFQAAILNTGQPTHRVALPQ
jgi:hypothetical protein